MRILLSIILLLCFSCPPALAAPITFELAKKIGITQTGVLERMEARRGVSAAQLKRTIGQMRPLFGKQAQPLAYVITLAPKGYIVVSPDTDIRPVIAYSVDGEFPFEERRDNVLLHLVLWDMQNRLGALPILSEDYKQKNRIAWEDYLAGDEIWVKKLSAAQQWGPHVTTTWGQFSPYNKYCPIDPETGNRSIVGCAATATAQIINYWTYPSSVSFDENDRYETNTRGIKVDEDYDLYDFPSFEELNQILSNIDYSNENDISALNFAVGISVEMDYTSSLSAASLFGKDLTEKFSYSSAANYYSSDYGFYDVLENDMKGERPAWLHVYTEGSELAGHAIVADGYKETGEYHVNYGWSGYCDGWYFLPEGLPEGYDAILRGVLKIYPYISNNVLYVDAGATSSGDGDSWANAFSTIREAVNFSFPGDEIWVKMGTYLLESAIQIDNGIRLYGGFGGWETKRDQRDWQTNVTTVDAQGTSSCFYLNNVDNATMDGFVIRRGNSDYGGGIYNTWSSPTVANCTFSENSAKYYGGGIYNYDSSPTITGCAFSKNSAESSGGGIYNGGTSSPTITNCTFSDNSVDTYGGGIYNHASSPTITGCAFSKNSADSGGGIFNHSSSLTITNCTFSQNSAEYYGGGINNYSSSSTTTNCTFSGNSAKNYGGGIYNYSSSSPTITNCILWNDSPNEIDGYDFNPVVTYSDVQNGYQGEGNMDTDPLFVGGGDYRLAAGSPCIDTGTSSGAPNTDIDGNPRPQGSGYDMGAYEFAPPCPDCSGGAVMLTNVTFPPGRTCECVGTISITIGSGVTIPKDAMVTFKAPTIKVQPGFHAETGAVVNMRQQ
ncbi:MAG: C10 family peptidase [Desulfobacteraceae bacterium]|nr:C10 family peptidase [Desulfobacteraceae bacterium]